MGIARAVYSHQRITDAQRLGHPDVDAFEAAVEHVRRVRVKDRPNPAACASSWSSAASRRRRSTGNRREMMARKFTVRARIEAAERDVAEKGVLAKVCAETGETERRRSRSGAPHRSVPR